MKQQTKAALLSVAILPGLGQLIILRRPKRGLAFMLPALAAIGWLIHGLMTITSTLMDEALRGTLPPDPVAIAARLSEASVMQGANLAFWIMAASWIGSLADIYLVKDKP